ncbi:MAG: hypothetical protein HY223_07915 [Thaumarchaeota archaeon]|nr:hypothetical protein [Nitrososphaerota archaeon]
MEVKGQKIFAILKLKIHKTFLFAMQFNAYIEVKSYHNGINCWKKMVSGYHNSELLNFFGIKESRKYIRICVRCGSDNIHQEQNCIECRECGKVLSTKHN